jgi:hypothetical protein
MNKFDLKTSRLKWHIENAKRTGNALQLCHLLDTYQIDRQFIDKKKDTIEMLTELADYRWVVLKLNIGQCNSTAQIVDYLI